MSLTDDIASAARDIENELLIGTGRVLHAVKVPSGGGGRRRTWEPGDANVKCAIAPIGSGEANTDEDQLNERSTHVLSLPAGTEIGDDDRFEFDDLGTFEVTSRRLRSMEFTRRVEVVEAAPE